MEKTIEEYNGNIINYLEDIMSNMNSKEKTQISLRYLDMSCIVTALKALDYYHNTFEEQMKKDFAKIKSDHKKGE